MNEFFLKIINMSISASWLIFAVLILRLVLKKAPKWVNVLLWGIVAIRLICPFSFESALSLIPSAETFPKKIISGPSFDVQSGITPVDNRINDYLGDRYFEGVTVPANNGNTIMTILTIVWTIGILLLVAYTVISYWRLHREIDTAVRYKDNIFQSENVSSPFVLGLIKPRIYLPFKLDGQDMEHVVAHEQAHIRRKYHFWKPLGFLLLTIHWFNPLMWLAYVLLCRDIELACDEKVIKGLSNEQRADYTQALVACSVNHRMIAACPLTFGEVGVKERVKSVMNYKKPAFWVIIIAVIVCVGVAVCFLTNPKQDRYTLRIVVPAGSQEEFVYTDEEVSTVRNSIKIWSGDGLGDTEVLLFPVNKTAETGYTATYLTHGMPVEFDAEKDTWFKIGVNMQNSTNEDIIVYVEVENVEVRILNGKKLLYQEFGEMLFTHFGVSGPLILTASAMIRPDIAKEPLAMEIDLKPALAEEQLDKRVLKDFEEAKNKQFKNSIGKLFPAKMIPVMIRLSGIDPDKKVNEITKEERLKFVRLIKAFPLTLNGLRDFNEAIITKGGVRVSEVNPSTMESKLVRHLYFCGEVLDLDAVTGGFNLQIAWSTGHLAGTCIE